MITSCDARFRLIMFIWVLSYYQNYFQDLIKRLQSWEGKNTQSTREPWCPFLLYGRKGFGLWVIRRSVQAGNSVCSSSHEMWFRYEGLRWKLGLTECFLITMMFWTLQQHYTLFYVERKSWQGCIKLKRGSFDLEKFRYADLYMLLSFMLPLSSLSVPRMNIFVFSEHLWNDYSIRTFEFS